MEKVYVISQNAFSFQDLMFWFRRRWTVATEPSGRLEIVEGERRVYLDVEEKLLERYEKEVRRSIERAMPSVTSIALASAQTWARPSNASAS